MSPEISRARLADGSICNLDKPAGWTSFDVVNKLRYASRVRKVGHAGTLDPFATGVLLICFGSATKKVEQLMQLDKEYVGTMELGTETDTHDLEGKVTATFAVPVLARDDIEGHARRYRGEIMQTPPLFSALKKEGRRLYEIARSGETVEVEPRRVTVYELEILAVRLPEVTIRLTCSRGTYVRALVRDLGRDLGCGAYVKSLRRMRVGEYGAAQSVPVQQFLERLID
ncbi:MAG: tRNA pseudouridine(55) synthase TruB [bacterium]